VGVLRVLAAIAPVVVAVDDVQWLDTASASMLAFAARRLSVEPVAFLLARRGQPGEPAPLGLDKVPYAIRRIAPGPLSLGALGQPANLTAAEESRVVDVSTGRIRFTHPLLAATLQDAASAPALRHAHARLARVVEEPERRARHLAAAADAPDELVAAALDEAARRAHGRGAPDAAAAFATLAARATPVAAEQERIERLTEAARLHVAPG